MKLLLGIALLLGLSLGGDVFAQHGPPAGEGGPGRKPFAGVKDPEQRRSALEAWKSRRAASAVRGEQATAAVSPVVGRASLVLNNAGTVLYTKNTLGGTCDLHDIRAQNTWLPSHAYAAGDVVRPVGFFGPPNGFQGFNFQANNAGTSGAAEPTWPTTLGSTVGDVGVTWKTIALDPHEFTACTPMQLISRASGGAETVVTQEGDTLPDGTQIAGWAEFVAMNNSGKVAYRSALGGLLMNDRDDEGESGMFTAGPGAGATTRIAVSNSSIGGRSVCGFSAMTGINDAGQVVYDTYAGLVGNECDEDNHGLVRFTQGTGNQLLVQQGSTVGAPSSTVVGFGADTDPGGGVRCTGCNYQNFDGLINSSGHVPVVLHLADGTQGVYNFTGPGAATQVARSGGSMTAIGPRTSINNSDQVVYRATVGGLDEIRLFTPPSTTTTIVSVDDTINGKVISSLGAFFDVNNSGHVVFQAVASNSDNFYFWNGSTSTQIATGATGSLASEMITLNNSDTVAYVTGTTSQPDEPDGGAEGHENGGLFTWTSGGGAVKQIAVGDTVGGFNVTGVFAQHVAFVRRNLNSQGCVATEYFVNGDDPEQDCTEGDTSAGCYPNGSGKLFVSCTTATCPTITVNPAILPNAVQGAPYNQTLTGSGGSAPYTFAVTAGSLPPGFNLSSAGALTGPATSTGTFNFTVTATDSALCTGSRAYSVGVGTVAVTLAPPARTVVVSGAAGFTVTISPTQTSSTIVTLTSGNPGIASVPATVTVPANTASAFFNATGVAVGGPITITAALPASFGAAPATATVTVIAVVQQAIVPTLSFFGFAVLALFLAAAGILFLRSR